MRGNKMEAFIDGKWRCLNKNGQPRKRRMSPVKEMQDGERSSSDDDDSDIDVHKDVE